MRKYDIKTVKINLLWFFTELDSSDRPLEIQQFYTNGGEILGAALPFIVTKGSTA
jgi:hypothetical protein